MMKSKFCWQGTSVILECQLHIDTKEVLVVPVPTKEVKDLSEEDNKEEKKKTLNCVKVFPG